MRGTEREKEHKQVETDIEREKKKLYIHREREGNHEQRARREGEHPLLTTFMKFLGFDRVPKQVAQMFRENSSRHVPETPQIWETFSAFPDILGTKGPGDSCKGSERSQSQDVGVPSFGSVSELIGSEPIPKHQFYQLVNF